MQALSVIRSVNEISLVVPTLQYELIEVQSFGDVSTARNTGVKRSQSNWLLFVDGDCLLSTTNMSLLLQVSNSFSSATPAIWGGLYQRQIKGPAISRAYNWIQRAWVLQSISYQSTNDVLGIESANLLGGILLIPKVVFKQIGGFNHEIPWGGEETELLRRAQRLGIKTYLIPGLEIQHDKNLNVRGFLRRAWKQGWSKGLYNLRTPTNLKSIKHWLFLRADKLTLYEALWIGVFAIIMQIACWRAKLWCRLRLN